MSSVEDDIQNVDKRWNDLNKNLQTTLADIEALQGQLQEYRDTVDSVDEKISAVETEVNVERIPVSDVEEMKKHIQQLEALKERLEELKPGVKSAIEAGDSIQEGNPSADTAAVEAENKKVQDHYDAVQDKLTDEIDKNKKMAADLEEYWEQEGKLEEQFKETGINLEENKPTVMDAGKLKEQLEKAKVCSTPFPSVSKRVLVHNFSYENEVYLHFQRLANLISIWKGVHQDSFWNRGKRQLGNGLLYFYKHMY